LKVQHFLYREELRCAPPISRERERERERERGGKREREEYYGNAYRELS